MSGDVSTRSSDVNEPQINVDHFYRRPTYHVVGLLSEQSEIPPYPENWHPLGSTSRPRNPVR